MNEGEIKVSGESPLPRRRRPRYRLRRFCFFFTILLFIWWFNNFTLKTAKVEIKSCKLSSSVRIAVISDLHASTFGISNKRIIKKICKADPDAVMVLGDMYTSGSPQNEVDIAVELIRGIADEGYPVYFVTGEHDLNDGFIEDIARTGAHVMNYKEEIAEINGNKFQIMGIDNTYYTTTFDLRREFTPRDDCFSILLAHIPDYEKLSAFRADLTLCADTHGGMIQLPFDLGPVYSSDYGCLFPQIHSNLDVYDKGLFPYDGGNMFITSGIGASPAPVRFNNRPEIAIIDLIPE